MAFGADETHEQIEERRQRLGWIANKLHASMRDMGCDEAYGLAQRLVREIKNEKLRGTAQHAVDDSFKFFRGFWDNSINDVELSKTHIDYLRSVTRLAAHMAFTGNSVFTLRCSVSFSRNMDLHACEALQVLINSQYIRLSAFLPLSESEPQKWLQKASQFKGLIPSHQARLRWMAFVNCLSPFR